MAARSKFDCHEAAQAVNSIIRMDNPEDLEAFLEVLGDFFYSHINSESEDSDEEDPLQKRNKVLD